MPSHTCFSHFFTRFNAIAGATPRRASEEVGGAGARGGVEGDEVDDAATVRGWGDLKDRMASSGAILAVARLADIAAREICNLGAGWGCTSVLFKLNPVYS